MASSEPEAYRSAGTAVAKPLSVYAREYLRTGTGRGLLALMDQAIVSGTSFLTAVLVGRHCDASALGVYSLAFSIIVFAVGIQLSLVTTPYTIFVMRLADHCRATHAGHTLAQVLVLCGVCTLIVSGAALTGHTWLAADDQPVVWLLALIMPFVLLRDFVRRMAFAHLRMSLALWVDMAASFIQLGAIAWYCLTDHLSAAAALMAIGLGSAVAAVTTLWQSRASYRLQLKGLGKSIRRDWRLGKWLFADQMVSVVHLYMLNWVLAFSLGMEATGIFAACASLVAVASPIVQGMGNVLSPSFARVAEQPDARDVLRLFWKASWIMLALVGIFPILAAFFGGELVSLIYHQSAYAGQTLVVFILALRMLVSVFVVAAHHGLVALERPHVSFWCTLLGLTVSFMTALTLIGPYGIPGAAFGWLVGSAAETLAVCCGFLRYANAFARRGQIA